MATKSAAKGTELGGTVHLVLQGKGGVGKSTCSAFLTQYLLEKGREVEGFDVDPVNHTLAAYKGLPVTTMELMENGEVNPRHFDAVVERFLTTEKDFVVDTGASSFLALWHYVLSNDALPLLRNAGRRVLVHTIVAGGGALIETLENFRALAETLGDREAVVWLNEHDAPVRFGGKSFADMQVYQQHEAKVAGTILVEHRNRQTFGGDIRKMVGDRLTFKQALNGSGYTVMERQRLTIVWRDLTQQLDALALV